MVELINGCIDVGSSLRRIGDVSAANYVDGAGISLRIALNANAAHAPSNVLTGSRPDVARQGRSSAVGMQPRLCMPARRLQPDLGVSLAGSDAARQAFGDALSSALLEDALWRWAWMHEGARTFWQTTQEGARVIVAVLTGGRPPVHIGNGMAGRIDGQVVRVLAELGWRIVPDQFAPATPD